MRATLAVAAAVFVAVAVAGCGGDGVPDLPPGVNPTAPPSVPASVDPLGHLPACQAPKDRVDAEVEGLVLPSGAQITSVRPSGPVTEVRGFVEQTPVEVREFYEQPHDIEVLTLEDETVEAEALYDRPGVRVYVKAKAICRTGSSLLAVVGRGDAEIPTPAGGLVN